ncbi:hypothetical protein G6F56_013761 [Rhizopus delemar]|nr:hypothetical protein G6F56_013761 [Rhizopus delemar]
MRTRGLAAFKVPDQVVFVDSFDTTAEERADGAAPYYRLPLADRRRTAAGPRPVAPAARSHRTAGARHAALLPRRVRCRQRAAATGRGQHRAAAGALPCPRHSGVLHRPAR